MRNMAVGSQRLDIQVFIGAWPGRFHVWKNQALIVGVHDRELAAIPVLDGWLFLGEHDRDFLRLGDGDVGAFVIPDGIEDDAGDFLGRHKLGMAHRFDALHDDLAINSKRL